MKLWTLIVSIFLSRGCVGLANQNESDFYFKEKFDNDLETAVAECSYPDTNRRHRHNSPQDSRADNINRTRSRNRSNSQEWHTNGNNSKFIPLSSHESSSSYENSRSGSHNFSTNLNLYRFKEQSNIKDLHTDGQRLLNFTRDNSRGKHLNHDTGGNLVNASKDWRIVFNSSVRSRDCGQGYKALLTNMTASQSNTKVPCLEDNNEERGHVGGQKRSSNVIRSTYNSRSNDVPACTALCVFTTLNVVDEHGIPVETSLVKLLEDGVGDRQRRRSQIQQVTSCFKTTLTGREEDNCVLAKQLADCFGLKFDRKPSDSSGNSWK